MWQWHLPRASPPFHPLCLSSGALLLFRLIANLLVYCPRPAGLGNVGNQCGRLVVRSSGDRLYVSLAWGWSAQLSQTVGNHPTRANAHSPPRDSGRGAREEGHSIAWRESGDPPREVAGAVGMPRFPSLRVRSGTRYPGTCTANLLSSFCTASAVLLGRVFSLLQT